MPIPQKIVDLKRSQIDEERTDREKGDYHFIPGGKKYVDNEARVADNIFFSWCQYNERDGYRMLNEWKARYGYDVVKNGEDPYWPEGANKTTEGYWQSGDVVLVKVPLDRELARREMDIKMAGADKKAGEAGKDRLRAFAKGLNKIEPGAGIDPDEMEHLLGKF